jgi:hypothetical protein
MAMLIRSVAVPGSAGKAAAAARFQRQIRTLFCADFPPQASFRRLPAKLRTGPNVRDIPDTLTQNGH